MSDTNKTWGHTVLGWFVVQDDEGNPAAGPAVIEAAPAHAVEQVFVTNPPAAVGGKVDFDQVYDAAGIGSDERQRVTKTLELLAALPSDTPTPVKKQIVEASLTAFGVPIDKIIESGVAEIQALEGYIRAGAADTQQVFADAETRIKAKEDEIRQLRTVMDERVQEQQAATKACNDKKLSIQQILEFFGQEAVARVVAASPKLRAPSRKG
ncbi:MAG: hypothetical protein NT151_13035 [Acidobacteria bacterium]|nr:hypothetical protein [Acidobacteriota bacterium]